MRVEAVDRARWLLTRDDLRSGHVVPAAVAAMVVRCFEMATIDDLVEVVNGSMSASDVRAVAGRLTAAGYLSAVGSDDGATERRTSKWPSNGWRAAERYFLQTDGYDFEHYQPNGTSAEDYARMRAYNAEEPDVERANAPVADPRHAYDLPPVGRELSVAPVTQALGRRVAPASLDASSLLPLLTLLARPVATALTPFPEAAPVLRKTSPSGGRPPPPPK